MRLLMGKPLVNTNTEQSAPKNRALLPEGAKQINRKVAMDNMTYGVAQQLARERGCTVSVLIRALIWDEYRR